MSTTFFVDPARRWGRESGSGAAVLPRPVASPSRVESLRTALGGHCRDRTGCTERCVYATAPPGTESRSQKRRTFPQQLLAALRRAFPVGLRSTCPSDTWPRPTAFAFRYSDVQERHPFVAVAKPGRVMRCLARVSICTLVTVERGALTARLIPHRGGGYGSRTCDEPVSYNAMRRSKLAAVGNARDGVCALSQFRRSRLSTWRESNLAFSDKRSNRPFQRDCNALRDVV